MTMIQKEYLRRQLNWVYNRMKALDSIESTLNEMRELAVYARDNELTSVEAQDINKRLRMLQKEVEELDEKSREYRLSCY